MEPRLFLAGFLALVLAACGERAPSAPAAPARIALAEIEAEIEAELAARDARTSGAAIPGHAGPSEVTPEPRPEDDVLTVGARLLDESARPLSGATLEWLVPGADGFPEVALVSSSDPTGAVWLRIPRAELAPELPLALAAGGPERMRTLVMVERARFEQVALLSLGELTLRAGGTLRGRVLDEHGHGLEGALVGLAPELGELTAEQSAEARLWPTIADLGLGAVPPITRTDAAGRYVLAGMPSGRFAVVATWFEPGATPRLAEREEGVLVSPGAETPVRDLVLREPLLEELITGVVLDPSGKPVEGALVALEAGGARHGLGAQSSPTGRFALLAPAGRVFQLAARDPEGRWGPTSLADVSPGGRDLVVRLGEAAPHAPARLESAPSEKSAPKAPGPAELRGRLRLGGDVPGSWNVRVGLGNARTILDHEGAFTLTGLAAGKTQLYLSTSPGTALTRWLMIELELHAGTNEWALDLAVGTLALANLPPAEPQRGVEELDLPEYSLTSQGDGFLYTVLFQEPPEHALELEQIPAGHLVLRYRGPGATHDGIDRWPALSELELAAGETRTLTLP